jgi:hypothetical protein
VLAGLRASGPCHFTRSFMRRNPIRWHAASAASPVRGNCRLV